MVAVMNPKTLLHYVEIVIKKDIKGVNLIMIQPNLRLSAISTIISWRILTMSLAKRCDKCGNIYVFRIRDKTTILDWDGETVFVRGEFKDLCPMCMEKLMKWFESEDD